MHDCAMVFVVVPRHDYRYCPNKTMWNYDGVFYCGDHAPSDYGE